MVVVSSCREIVGLSPPGTAACDMLLTHWVETHIQTAGEAKPGGR